MKKEEIAKATNYLCICQWGHSRSVGMARALHGRGFAAVAIGAGSSGNAVNALSHWADVILTAEPIFDQVVPPYNRHKVKCLNIGPDRWVNPYSSDLAAVVNKKLDELGVPPKK